MAKIITLPSILPKNHFSLYAAYEMQRLCQPFFQQTGITAFGYTRLYNDGSRFVLLNRADWLEHCYNKGYVYLTRLNRHPSCYQSGYFLWDAWAPTHEGHNVVGVDAAENFNIGRGLSIIEKTGLWLDKFEFASTPDNYAINNFYINHLETLHQFIQTFKDSAQLLIDTAIKNRAIVPCPAGLNMSQDVEDTQVIHDLSAIKKQQLITNIFSLHLTDREIECVHWLMKGKTGPEIALILDVSSRTVEKFIANLKNKLGCYTLFQLGQKINALKIDTLLN